MELNNSLPSSLVSRKLKELVEAFRRIDAVSKRDDLIKMVVTGEETPSHDAARRLAIINTDQVEDIRNEYNSPSFDSGAKPSSIGVYGPSKFAREYAVSESYIELEDGSVTPNLLVDKSTVQIITLEVGGKELGIFVFPTLINN